MENIKNKICCVSCYSPLKNNDLLIIDCLNFLYHNSCYRHSYELIKSVDTFGNIKEKYHYYSEQPFN